jgi:hypothetical protein
MNNESKSSDTGLHIDDRTSIQTDHNVTSTQDDSLPEGWESKMHASGISSNHFNYLIFTLIYVVSSKVR